MTPDKVRELSNEELVNQGRDLAEQIFRLRFKLAMGQTEGTQRLQSLKKDVARIKTIQCERQVNLENKQK